MTPQQKSRVEQLSEATIKEIDRNLLENVTHDWSRVSRVVLATMIEREEGVTGLPEIFYFGRIASLIKEGLLEVKGELTDTRSCEVRLPSVTK